MAPRDPDNQSPAAATGFKDEDNKDEGDHNDNKSKDETINNKEKKSKTKERNKFNKKKSNMEEGNGSAKMNGSAGTDPDAMTRRKLMLVDTDQLADADSLWTVDSSAAVKIRMKSSGTASRKPITVMTAINQCVQEFPDAPALGVKRDGEWKMWTFADYYDDIVRAARSFIKLGLEPYHGVGIIGFNSPEWFIADLGAIFAGGLATGIYTTSSADACQYIAADSKANIIVVENDAQLQKILKVRDSLPDLKAIVQYIGEIKTPQADVYTWEQFMAIGADIPEEALVERLKMQAPNKCCTVIYTSGTTGNPKGVMLSHDNLVWTSYTCGHILKIQRAADRGISYLPLSHVAAQMLDVFLNVTFGACIYFAQPDALKGTLVETLKEVKPTYFLGVPRVWEKIQEKMLAIGANVTGLKKKISVWAKDVGLRGTKGAAYGEPKPWGWTIASMAVFNRVKAALGLDECKTFASGAAPISQETVDYFLSLNIPLFEVYGMSESSGPQTLNTHDNHRFGSAGKVFDGAEIEFADQDKDGNGEICMIGRHVFMGYLNNIDKTKEAMDSNGRLHSGDVGRLDEDGYLYITGRIKELIITAGGENIPPVLIEDAVKAECPAISNCMLIGDKKKFLSMLVSLKTDVDPETTMPLDTLTKPTQEWVKSLGSDATTVSQIISTRDEKVYAAITAAITRANKKSTSRAQVVQKFEFLPIDFSIPGEELGPTLKLKRPVVVKKYHDLIEKFYEE